MPLRAEVRHLYNTAEYRRERREEIRHQGGPICRDCHRWVSHINLAHLNHDPQDRRPGDRVLLCASCHAKHDAKQRLAMTRRTQAAGRARVGWPQRSSGRPIRPARGRWGRARPIDLFEGAA